MRSTTSRGITYSSLQSLLEEYPISDIIVDSPSPSTTAIHAASDSFKWAVPTKKAISHSSILLKTAGNSVDNDDAQYPADRNHITDPSKLQQSGIPSPDTNSSFLLLSSTADEVITPSHTANSPLKVFSGTRRQPTLDGAAVLHSLQSHLQKNPTPTATGQPSINAYTPCFITSTVVESRGEDMSKAEEKEESGAEDIQFTNPSSDSTSHSLLLPQSTRTECRNRPCQKTDASRPTWGDATMEEARSTQKISKQGAGVIFGGVWGASLIFICIFFLHRFFISRSIIPRKRHLTSETYPSQRGLHVGDPYFNIPTGKKFRGSRPTPKGYVLETNANSHSESR